MAAQYEVVYPSKGVILFDGGLDTKFEKSIIPDNESPDCLNVVFDNGAVASRSGSSKLNTALVGSYACDGLYTRRDDDGSETMIAFHGGTARYLAVTSFHTIPSALSVFTAGVRVAATQYRDCMFIGNGGVIPYKYNGSDFTRHGVYPLTNVLSAACGGAGNIQSGTVSYKITGLNSYLAESDLSAAAITLTVTASCTISLSSVPVAPQSYGVSTRRVYRYGPSNTTYVLVGTIANNTTTTFSDTTQTGTSNAPTDNGVPPKYNVCIYHSNRLFVNDVNNPNYVWYSELGEPFTFSSTNFFKVGDATSDLVKSFAISDNALAVFCENSEWLNYMASADDADWSQVRVRSTYGCKSPHGIWYFGNKVGFPAYQNSRLVGLAALAGAAVEPSSTLLTVSVSGSDLLSDKIEPDIFDMVDTYVGNISSITYQNKAYIAVTHGSGQTTNNRIYCFDFSSSNLAKSQKYSLVPFTGLNVAQFAIYGGNLYYGSSLTDGFVYKLDSTLYSDNAGAIDAYYWSKEYSGHSGHENLPKDFRKIKFLADLSGNYPLRLTWRVDSDSGVGQSKTLSLDSGSPLWGTMMWGIDIWGAGRSQYEFEVPLGQTQGKRIQFKFDNQNTTNQKFKIHRMTFTYNVRGTT